MKPRLVVSTLGKPYRIYVLTRYRIVAEGDGRQQIIASTKYDVTDDFHGVIAEVDRRLDELGLRATRKRLASTKKRKRESAPS